MKRTAEDLAFNRMLRRYVGVVAESVAAADGIVRLRDRGKPYSSIRSGDLVWVEGSLRIEGDARLFGSRLDFRDGGGLDNGIPLSIQRAGSSGTLEIAIGNSNSANNALVIGPLDSGTPPKVSPKLIARADGNVGIGTMTPTHKFHVLAPDAVGLFESTGSQAYLRLQTSEGDKNRVEITNRPGGRLSLYNPTAGDVLNITKDGNVGIR